MYKSNRAALLILLILLVATLLTALIACHEHTFSGTWTYDEAQHWHKATCEHNELTDDKDNHTFQNGVCTVCGYRLPSVYWHQLVEVKAVAATCESAGNINYWQCTSCDKVFSDSLAQAEITLNDTIIAPLSHNWEISVLTIPSCDTDGLITFVCKNDSTHTHTETIDALGHDYDQDNAVWSWDGYDKASVTLTCLRDNRHTVTIEVTNIVSETIIQQSCTANGIKTHKASVLFENVTYTDILTEVLKPLNHDWDEGAVTTQPTCETEGVLTFTCKNDSSHTYTEYVAALQHDWDEGVITTLPDCDVEGIRTFTCKNDSSHTYTESIAALQHDWDDGIVTTQPTCETEGILTFTCKNNPNHTSTVAIDKLEHVFDSDWNHDDGYHWKVCVNCKNEIKQLHTVDDNFMCTVCNVQFNFSAGLLMELKDGYYAVAGTGTTANNNTVVIPETFNGLPVKEINDGAFSFSKMENITIPDSITKIGNEAFMACRLLQYVSLPKNLTEIGDSMFYQCVKLLGVELPSTVTSIGYRAFASCISLISINLPEGVTTIGEGAFYSCTSLTSITLPEPLTEISDNLFMNCRSLQSITIPQNVTSIGYMAFTACQTLEKIVIPDNVKYIGEFAFMMCTNLKYVKMSDNVLTIQSSTFRSCRNLEKIEFGADSKLNQIESYVFWNCEKLKTVVIPSNVTEIHASAFWTCYSLESITIPASVVSIIGSFNGCDALNAIYIEDLTAWCNTNFASYTSNPLYYAHNLYLNGKLVTSLEIPQDVTSISAFTFAGATCLTSVTLHSNVTEIGTQVFYECFNLAEVRNLSKLDIEIGSEEYGYVAYYASIIKEE